jgi:hypothetical protein
MFDLLSACPLLRQHIRESKVGFGINHRLTDFQTTRKKDLDLVICTPSLASTGTNTVTFRSYQKKLGIELGESDSAKIASLPDVRVVPVGNVLVALEAKATMTAHIRALPRLHDELDSSHSTVHGDTDSAIAAALVVVNASPAFVSSDNNRRPLHTGEATVNFEPQPLSAQRTIAKVREIRRRSSPGLAGFDAMGIVLVDFANNGSPCELFDRPPAPDHNAPDHYANMIGRISTLYASKFSGI